MIAEAEAAAGLTEYTFVLKLNDRPGTMELIAATFAHRGISITGTLGHDASHDPDGHATIVLHFRAIESRKEAMKSTLARLSRVVSVHEHDASDATLRRCALLRLAAGANAPELASASLGTVQVVATDEATGEVTYSVMGRADDVDRLLDEARDSGELRGVTHAVLAL